MSERGTRVVRAVLNSSTHAFLLLALSLLALLSACDPASEGGSDAPASGDSTVAPGDVPLLGDFRRLEFAAPEYRTDRERGVGIVFPRGYLGPDSPAADTIVVRLRADPAAPAVARLIRSEMGVYALDVRSNVGESGALEHGYEDIGLPLIERPAGSGGEWLHVYYGTAPGGDTLTGWVRNDSTAVATTLWSERLPESPLFFLDPDSIAFYGAPEGARVPFEMAPAEGTQRFDYILYSLETRGEWMRAEVVSPSNYCFDPPAPKRDTLWLRYLDARGRPRLWYYTRGC